MNKFVGKYYIIGQTATLVLHEDVFAFKVLEANKKNYKLQLYRIPGLNLYKLNQNYQDEINYGLDPSFSYYDEKEDFNSITTISKADFSKLINHFYYETDKKVVMKTKLSENVKFHKDKIMAP